MTFQALAKPRKPSRPSPREKENKQHKKVTDAIENRFISLLYHNLKMAYRVVGFGYELLTSYISAKGLDTAE